MNWRAANKTKSDKSVTGLTLADRKGFGCTGSNGTGVRWGKTDLVKCIAGWTKAHWAGIYRGGANVTVTSRTGTHLDGVNGTIADGVRNVVMLARLNVSLMVAVSALFGFLLARPEAAEVYTGYGGSEVSWIDGLVGAFGGTFMLAAACSVFNQVQERDIDACFSRTCQRPLPAGRIGAGTAMLLGCVWLCGAFAFFTLAEQPVLFVLTVCILVSYNALYTPLKRRTPFALLVGSIPGAMPPVMGWVAAGGSISSPVIVLVYAVYYLWQVPHFWLRAERDSKEYAAAGMPIPPVVYGKKRYARLLRLWFHAYLAGVLALPLFSLMHSVAARISLVAMAVILMVLSASLLQNHRKAFSAVNGSMLLVMTVLVTDALIL